jgi:hypothetical protein
MQLTKAPTISRHALRLTQSWTVVSSLPTRPCVEFRYKNASSPSRFAVSNCSSSCQLGSIYISCAVIAFALLPVSSPLCLQHAHEPRCPTLQERCMLSRGEMRAGKIFYQQRGMRHSERRAHIHQVEKLPSRASRLRARGCTWAQEASKRPRTRFSVSRQLFPMPTSGTSTWTCPI